MTTLHTISRQSSANREFVKNCHSLSVMPTAGGLWRVDAVVLAGVALEKDRTKHCYVGVGLQWVDVGAGGAESQVSDLVIAKLNALVSIYAPCIVGQRAAT